MTVPGRECPTSLGDRFRDSRLGRSVLGLRRRLRGTRTAAEFWSEQAGTWDLGGGRHWTELQQVQEIINERVSGEPNVNPYLYLLRTRLAGCLPVRSALTVGCGSGELERGFAPLGLATEHVGLDVAPGAIARAEAAAREAGLTQVRYHVADANTVRLEPGSFDVVFGVYSVHHVENLEHLFEQVALALRPEGFLFLNEFVGPTRFQWTDRQLEVVNGLLSSLPEEMRVSLVDGRPKRSVRRPTIAEMIATDPSEAVKSGELLEVASKFFEILEIRPYGGTVLHLLLDDIAGRFQRPEPWARQLLASIAEVEWALIASGDLPSDFAVVVAKPRSRLPG